MQRSQIDDVGGAQPSTVHRNRKHLHQARRAVAAPKGWADGLQLRPNMEPYPILANALHAMRHDPQLKGVVGLNQLTLAISIRRPPPWCRRSEFVADQDWSDNDDRLLTEYLQRNCIRVPQNIAADAAETAASENAWHPVRKYLESLPGGETGYLDVWLSRYLGAPDTPYVRAVGRRALIAAVARVYKPGCKVDNVLVLEGGQGGGKSTACGVLGGSWFADRLSEISSKDAALELNGVWILELAELDALGKADSNAIKAYITRTHDRFRPPYAKRVVNVPRQSIFIGTMNPDGRGYLKDVSGGRRFWPVACGSINIPLLRQERDLLWAEARDAFHKHEPWWLETPELISMCAAEQADRYQGDAWDPLVTEFLKGKSDTSVQEVLESVSVPRERWDGRSSSRAAHCLLTAGFERYRSTSEDGSRPWRYRRIESQES